MIDHDHVGRRAALERAAGQAEQFGRPRRHRAQQRRELDFAAVDEAQAGGEHGLEPDRARRCFGERQALGFDVLRIVIRHDRRRSGRRQRLDQRLAVVLGAQRRRHLQEGAVGADVDFIERDVIDRGRRGDVQPGILGAAQHIERSPRR